jgi:polysaccharide biosynthesis protein PslH
VSRPVSPKPRILFITSDVPRTGGSGGQIVTWRLLESFAALGTVDVLALTPPDPVPSPELSDLASKVELVPLPHFRAANTRPRTSLILASSLVRREPFRVTKFRSKDAVSVLRNWLDDSRYDLLHADHLASAQYRSLAPRVPATLMEHNVEWQQFSQLAAEHSNPAVRAVLRADSNNTRAWEARVLDDFGHVFVLSEDDRDRLLEARPDLGAKLSVWPIPVTVSPLPAPAGPPTFLVLGTLTSVGRIRGLRWFLSEVWGKVREHVPEARLEIVGAEPPEDIRQRDGSDGIRVRGFVEDLEPILATVSACAIPLFVGSGVRVKVVELIARAIPCVGTSTGLQGLMPLEGCTEVAEPEEWAAALAAIAADPEGPRQQARRGAERLAIDNSASRSGVHLEAVLRDLRVLESAPRRS